MNPLSAAHVPRWREYLRRSGDEAQLARAAFQRRFKEIDPLYDEVVFPLPLFGAAFVGELARVGLELLEMVASIPARIFDGDYRRWLAFQGIEREEADSLLEFCTPRFVEMATQFARPDCLATNDGFRVVEINVAPPIGGASDCDLIADEFRATPFHQFLVGAGVVPEAPRTGLVWRRTLLELARASATVTAPVFFEALADPEELAVPGAQHREFVRAVEEAGFRHSRGLIQHLRVTDDGAFFGSTRVDLVFTAFTHSELLRCHVPWSQVSGLARADAGGRVDFVASPLSTVFDNKANLELLTSAQFATHWSATERQLIARYVAPTRRLSSGCVHEAIACRCDYVLKPAREFGGAGVLVGRNAEPERWEAALRTALAGRERHVLQEVVPELWRYQVELGEDTISYEVCLGPMYFGRRYAGTFLRMMSARDGVTPVINAAAGAAVGTALAQVE